MENKSQSLETHPGGANDLLTFFSCVVSSEALVCWDTRRLYLSIDSLAFTSVFSSFWIISPNWGCKRERNLLIFRPAALPPSHLQLLTFDLRYLISSFSP